MIGRAVTGGRGTALSFPCRQYNGWLARLAKGNLTEDLHEQIRGLWNYRATPQNATYKNANNIYTFQRITSLLLHIIFSFCMIIPQSFHFVGQIVRFVCFLQNVFQTTPLVLQAYLQEAREIVNDTKTFLCGDCPDPGCNCCFEVTDCLGVVFVHSVLQTTPKVKFCGV